MNTNLGLVPPFGKEKCLENSQENSDGANDARTEALLNAMRPACGYGSAAWLARQSGVCLASTRKAIEGEHRLPASLLRSMLLLHSPADQAALISLWLDTHFEVSK